jgi:pimeloyl-ACP methyl ester carboxylesterase
LPPGDAPLPKPLPAIDVATQIALLLHPEQNPTRHVPFEHAARFPFEPLAPAVSPVNAWWLADAAWLAYSRSESDVKATYESRTGLAAELIHSGATDVTCATGSAFAIVAFRGTQADQWQDVFSDLRWKPASWDVGHVHSGFAEALDVVWNQVKSRLDALPAGCEVWFTGHSLGAALATLAAWRFERTKGVCTFGSPLVGNHVFTAGFNARFGTASRRYVNGFDIVTRVPPETFAFPLGRYTHTDVVRWIDRDGRVGGAAPPPPFFSNVIGEGSFMLHLVTHLAALGFPALPNSLRDHTPLHYAVHVWNDLTAQSQ